LRHYAHVALAGNPYRKFEEEVPDRHAGREILPGIFAQYFSPVFLPSIFAQYFCPVFLPSIFD
jgi:hypothetical protein